VVPPPVPLGAGVAFTMMPTLGVVLVEPGVTVEPLDASTCEIATPLYATTKPPVTVGFVAVTADELAYVNDVGLVTLVTAVPVRLLEPGT